MVWRLALQEGYMGICLLALPQQGRKKLANASLQTPGQYGVQIQET